MSDLKISKTTWDLSPLYKFDDDPKMEKDKKEIEKKIEEFVKKWEHSDKYLKNVKSLKQALDEYNLLHEKYAGGGNLGYYFELRSALDQNSPSLKAKSQKTEEFAIKLNNKLQFFELNLAKIDSKLQKEFLKDQSLKNYEHFLERLFAQSKYLLSDKEEKILNLKSAPSYGNWVRMTEGFLSKEEREVLTEKGKKEKKNLSELMGLISSKNKKVRDSAAKGLNDIFEKFLEVSENEINAILLNKKIDDELRGYKRPDSSRHLADDIDTEIVDTVINSVSEKNRISQDFYKLKSKLFGVKKLEYHERNVEYGKVEKEYKFDQAAILVEKVLTNIDKEFGEIFRRLIENGQVDIHPRLNKRSGAACWHYLVSQPSYILLNHNNRLNDVLTIAHEFGHGINNELMRKAQNALNFSTPTSTAEIASTFMEDFVLEEILKEADEQLKLAIMMMRLNDEISSVFRQAAGYKFEWDLHQVFREKGYLSYKEIGQIFQKNMASYMGPGVEQSKGSENWWVYWSHIRMFFYVYSYASGTLISKSLQASLKENPQFIEKVKYFLSAGRSESPKQIFKNIGIDLTKKEFWEKGLQEIEKSLKETEKLAKKLGKV